MKILPEPIEFEWDAGNLDKNWLKHNITNRECEEVLIVDRFLLLSDEIHSKLEDRYIILGPTRGEKILYLVVTVRGNKVRIISARKTSKKESIFYEEIFKNS